MVITFAAGEMRATFKKMSNNQAGRDIKQYQEEVMALISLCSLVKQRSRAACERAGQSIGKKVQDRSAIVSCKLQTKESISLNILLKGGVRIDSQGGALEQSSSATHRRLENQQNKQRKRGFQPFFGIFGTPPPKKKGILFCVQEGLKIPKLNAKFSILGPKNSKKWLKFFCIHI